MKIRSLLRIIRHLIDELLCLVSFILEKFSILIVFKHLLNFLRSIFEFNILY